MSLKIAALHHHPECIPQLAKWFENQWPDYFAERDTIAFFEGQANDQEFPFAMLLFDDEELVGTVALKADSIDDYADRSPWVAGLFVAPQHRRKGYGQLLATTATRVAFGMGEETIWAGAAQPHVIAMFEALGWSKVGEAEQGEEVVAVLELEKPPEPPTFYELVGGAENVRALVDRFYDLMDELPEAKLVRDMHATSLRSSRQKLFEFLSGWMGGPQLYIEKHGHPRLRMRHFPFEIGTEARDQWLICMDRALDDVVADEAVREQLRDSFTNIADHMRNRRGP